MIEKEKIDNVDSQTIIQLIKMSYLEFIEYIIFNDVQGQIFEDMFDTIIRLCIKCDSYEFVKDKRNKTGISFHFGTDEIFDENEFLNKIFGYEKLANITVDLIQLIKNNETALLTQFCDISLDSAIKVVDLYNKCFVESENRDVFISGKDFEDLKDIILFQNISDYDNTYINPDVKKVLDEALEFKLKSQEKLCGFEDQTISIHVATGASFDDMSNWTIRTFGKVLERYDMKLNYQIFKTGEMSGMVEFKEPIKSWLIQINHNKYDGLLVDVDDYKNKISGNAAKQDAISKLQDK
jgi:hypothetical protein